MAPSSPADEAAVRQQAYYFWEAEGRPEGREHEFWQRALVAVTEKAQLDTLTKSAPRKAAKSKVAKAAPKAKAVPKVKAAASAAKAGPSKTRKAVAKKPKAKK